MDKKVTGIVAYITIIGWLIAFLAGDKEGGKFHLNQALVLNLASLINGWVLSRILGLIPILGGIISWVISIVIFVFIIYCKIYKSNSLSCSHLVDPYNIMNPQDDENQYKSTYTHNNPFFWMLYAKEHTIENCCYYYAQYEPSNPYCEEIYNCAYYDNSHTEK